MYEAFFGFDDRPFAAVPRTDRYFPGEAIESARHTLLRCIDRAEGSGLVVGATGLGKTLLCQVLVDHFRNRFAPVFLSCVRLTTPKELLQAVLFELGLPYRRQEEGELRLALLDRLTPAEGRPEGMLLIVDEAHTLSPKLLEELRLLTNVIRGGSARVRLVLAGAPVLEERFASPQLASFNQRLTARCYLDGFSSSETHQYILAQTAAAGADPDRVWSEEGLRTVHQQTDGCPRVINQLCDHALLLAARVESMPITAMGVEQAWAELQQLPMPTSDTQVSESEREPEEEAEHSVPNATSTVIEFGELDDVGMPPNRAIEPAEPIEQLDQIVSQLASVEESLEESILPGPQVELDFGRPERHVVTLDDRTNNAIEEDAVSDESEVVLHQFVSLEGTNIVHLAPSSQPISVDTMPTAVPTEVAPNVEPSIAEPQTLTEDIVFPELCSTVNEPTHMALVEPRVAPLRDTSHESPRETSTHPAKAPTAQEPSLPSEALGGSPAVPVPPREYRQLFSQLRRRGTQR